MPKDKGKEKGFGNAKIQSNRKVEGMSKTKRQAKRKAEEVKS